MTGWIKWNGGECPTVDKRAVVTVKFRDMTRPSECGEAFRFRWYHWPSSDPDGRDNDIIAYRLSPSDAAAMEMDWRDVPLTAGMLVDALSGAWTHTDIDTLAQLVGAKIERSAREHSNHGSMPHAYLEHVLSVLLEVDKHYPASGEFSEDIGLAIGQTRRAIESLRRGTK